MPSARATTLLATSALLLLLLTSPLPTAKAREPGAPRSFYEVLGVPPHAQLQEVRKAYRRGALRWHPDKNPGNVAEAEEKFRELANAWEVLRDPARRRDYDDRRGGAGGHEQDYSQFVDLRDAEQIFAEFFQGVDDPFEEFLANSPWSGQGARAPERKPWETVRTTTTTTTTKKTTVRGGQQVQSATTHTHTDAHGRRVTKHVSSEIGLDGREIRLHEVTEELGDGRRRKDVNVKVAGKELWADEDETERRQQQQHGASADGGAHVDL